MGTDDALLAEPTQAGGEGDRPSPVEQRLARVETELRQVRDELGALRSVLQGAVEVTGL